jgi:hypothetical protein
MLHWEGYVVRKLFEIKKNPNVKTFYVIILCVSMFIACIGYVFCGVLWIPLHSVTADIGYNWHPIPPISQYNEGLL